MTGTPDVKPPQNNAQWARNVEKRIGGVEHPTSTRLGDWVLSTDETTGNLIASYNNGGSIILAEPPPGGIDPDAISTSGLPFIRVVRANPQAIVANTSTNINWDTIQKSTSEWQFTAPGTDLVVPRAGYYLCVLNVYTTLATDKAYSMAVGLAVDGAAFTVAEQYYTDAASATMASGCSDVLRLGAGAVLNAAVLSAGAVSLGISPRGVNAITSLAVMRLPIDL